MQLQPHGTALKEQKSILSYLLLERLVGNFPFSSFFRAMGEERLYVTELWVLGSSSYLKERYIRLFVLLMISEKHLDHLRP